jgi:LmbE family N-acetylglucosaminyl deacetylase
MAKKWLFRALLVLVPILLVGVLRESARQPVSAPTLADMQPISLPGIQRILILAPHCDDETLGPGGLIAAAREAGIEVRVAIATNGDGYLFATMEEFKNIYPRPADFIHMGEVRQQESLSALARLGVANEEVYFLGYPDRGTPLLLDTHWTAAKPYKSAYSETEKSPYPITYNVKSVYAGEDYLADLTSIFETYRPDLVIYPHPEDVHPDHWGLNAFTRLALAEIEHSDPAYQPQQMTYLVHRPGFPVVRGYKPAESLVPPAALSAIFKDWLRFDLTSEELAAKTNAIEQYKSQLPTLRDLMVSFLRQNELFAPVSSVDMRVVAAGKPLDPSTWLDANGRPIPAVQLDPVGDEFSHKAVPATDLVANYAARTPDGMLWLCTQTSVKTAEDIPYALQIKALTENRILSYAARTEPGSGEVAAVRAGNYVCTEIALSGVQNPWAIFFSAEAESPDLLMPFDRVAWQIVYVK